MHPYIRLCNNNKNNQKFKGKTNAFCIVSNVFPLYLFYLLSSSPPWAKSLTVKHIKCTLVTVVSQCKLTPPAKKTTPCISNTLKRIRLFDSDFVFSSSAFWNYDSDPAPVLDRARSTK